MEDNAIENEAPSSQSTNKDPSRHAEENVPGIQSQCSQSGAQSPGGHAKESKRDIPRARSMSLPPVAKSQIVPSLSSHRRGSEPLAVIGSPTDTREAAATVKSSKREGFSSEPSGKDDEEPHQNKPASRSVATTCLLGVLYVVAVAAVAAALWWHHGTSEAKALVNASISHTPRATRLETTAAAAAAAACRGSACARAAALLQAAVDQRASPCNSFYRYSCGTWLDANSRPLGEVFREAFVAQVAERALATRVPTEGQNARQKAARFFGACYNTVTSSLGHLTSAKRLLAEGGVTWPRRNGSSSNALDAMLYMSTAIRLPVLLEFVFASASEKATIRPTKKLLEEIAARRRRMNRNHAVRYFNAVYKGFSSDNRPVSADKYRDLYAQEVAVFELLRLAISSGNRKNNASILTNAAMINHRTPSLSAEDWGAVLRKYWNISDRSKVDVVVENPRYFDAVFSRHKSVGGEKFMEFYSWLCVQAVVPFTNKRIVSLYYATRDSRSAHRHYCLAETRRFFPNVLEGNLLEEMMGGKYGMEDLRKVTRGIVRAMGTAKSGRPFNRGSCSDAVHALRESALLKFALLNPAGFDALPDMTENPLINWSLTKSAVTYLPSKGKETPASSARRRSLLSGAVFDDLDPWFYSSGLPAGAKYGGLGLRVATGLVEGFLGRRSGCRRLLAKASRRLKTCARRRVTAPSVLNVTTRTVVMTSSVLWSAYKGGEGGASGARFVQLTDDELFFVVQCLPLCGKPRGEVDCEWPLAHSAHFSRVFGCSSGDRMNLAGKCALWH
ncbi:endothelin-converting enzyme 1-like isoform X1 [Dermacentor albipictus]|uniref:endothelin-converting enzyme 1-like isoform X1 n=1 Tax=Dermacentor albipictus TaxID=60249 RepID=UPI0031FD9FA1